MAATPAKLSTPFTSGKIKGMSGGPAKDMGRGQKQPSGKVKSGK